MKTGIIFCGDVVLTEQLSQLFPGNREFVFGTVYSADALLMVDGLVIFWDERSPDMWKIKEKFERAGKSTAVILATTDPKLRLAAYDVYKKI